MPLEKPFALQPSPAFRLPAGSLVTKAPVPDQDKPGIHEQLKNRPGPGRIPFRVSASVTLQPSTTSRPNIDALRCASQAFEIHTIHFQIVEDAATLTGIDLFSLGGVIACSFELVKRTGETIPVTNSMVPVPCFAACDYLPFEALALTSSTGRLSSYVWRLPKPLIVPAGFALVPTFQHKGLLSYQLKVSIDYSGYRITNRFTNNILDVPYVAAFETTPVTPDGTEVAFTSTERDLVNPFSTPITIQRLTGRLYQLKLLSTGIILASPPQLVINAQTTMQLEDARGVQIIRNDTRFVSLFGPARGAIDLSFNLDPENYLVLTMKTGSVAFVDGTNAATVYRVFGQFGMIGTREVKI